jgi:predicted GNAT family acetyltransferase
MENKVSYQLIDNTDKSRFEFQIGENVAVSDYIISGSTISLTHVGIPKALENQGIASALMLASLKNIETRQLKVIPVCSFAVTYFQRHPEWQKLLG